MANVKVNEQSILEFLAENEGKLRVLLSADEKVRINRYKIKGKKVSRTIFMSEQLKFLINEFCIENDLKIGEFVELAIIEYLNRNGMEKKLQKIIITSTSSEDEGKQGKTEKTQNVTDKKTGEA